MKKLIYITIILCIGISCTNKGTLEGKKKIKDKSIKCTFDSTKDSVLAFPDAYKYTRHYRDSIDREIKAYSYRIYGDSNLLEEGLPDSMKLHNN